MLGGNPGHMPEEQCQEAWLFRVCPTQIYTTEIVAEWIAQGQPYKPENKCCFFFRVMKCPPRTLQSSCLSGRLPPRPHKERSGMLLNVLQCTEEPLPNRNVQTPNDHDFEVEGSSEDVIKDLISSAKWSAFQWDIQWHCCSLCHIKWASPVTGGAPAIGCHWLLQNYTFVSVRMCFCHTCPFILQE